MVDAPDQVRGADARRAPRMRALLGGKLSFNQGYFTLDCMVRDLSPLGARVRIPPGQALPARVYFLELRNGAAHECRVAWRRHPEAGLEFVRTCAADDDDEDLRVLRRLWAEAQDRSGVF